MIEITVKAMADTLDRDGAFALLDVISPDAPGFLFGKVYGLSSDGGVLTVHLNPGVADFTSAQRKKIDDELAKAVLFPALPVTKTREEEQDALIAALAARIEALEDVEGD